MSAILVIYIKHHKFFIFKEIEAQLECSDIRCGECEIMGVCLTYEIVIHVSAIYMQYNIILAYIVSKI